MDVPLPSSEVGDGVSLPPPPINPPLEVAFGVPEGPTLCVGPPGGLLVDDTLWSPLTVMVPVASPLAVPPTKSVGDLDMLTDRV